MASRAKHEEIFQHLHRAIVGGKYGPGARLPSDAVLARRFRVSRPTVAQALRDLRELGLVERRAGAGSFVRRSLGVGILGLLADGLEATEVAAPWSAELGRATRHAGWNLQTGEPVGDRDPDRVAREWAARGARGVFFAPLEHHPVRSAVNRALAERFAAQGIAVILLDRDIAEFPARSEHDLVGIDDFASGHEAAAHLLARGARRLVLVARPAFPATTDLRLAGVRAAVRRTEGAAVEFCVGDPADTTWLARVSRQTRCDALIGSNDLTAARLVGSLQSLGRRVPDEVMVMGFDDARCATETSPPLTTMRQPYAALATAAVEAMLSRLRQPPAPARRILLRADLVARASTTV